MEKLDYNKPLDQVIQQLRRINKEKMEAGRKSGTGISPLLRTENEQASGPTAQRPNPQPRNNNLGPRKWSNWGWNRQAVKNRLGHQNRVIKKSSFSNFRNTFRFGGPRQDLRHRLITTRFNQLHRGSDLRLKLYAHSVSERYIQYRKWQIEQRRKRLPFISDKRKKLFEQLLGPHQARFCRSSLQSFTGNTSCADSDINFSSFFGQPVRNALTTPPVSQTFFGRENTAGFVRSGSFANNSVPHFEAGHRPTFPRSGPASVDLNYCLNRNVVTPSRSLTPLSFESVDQFTASDNTRPSYHVVNGVPYPVIPRGVPTQSRQYGDPSWSEVHIESRPGMF